MALGINIADNRIGDNCKSCQAPILWVKMDTGNSMPVNQECMTIVTDEGKVVKGHVSHFVTCPDAEEHRKVKKS